MTAHIRRDGARAVIGVAVHAAVAAGVVYADVNTGKAAAAGALMTGVLRPSM